MSVLRQAILVWPPRESRARILHGQPLIERTATTLMHVDALLLCLATVRGVGYPCRIRKTLPACVW